MRTNPKLFGSLPSLLIDNPIETDFSSQYITPLTAVLGRTVYHDVRVDSGRNNTQLEPHSFQDNDNRQSVSNYSSTFTGNMTAPQYRVPTKPAIHNFHEETDHYRNFNPQEANPFEMEDSPDNLNVPASDRPLSFAQANATIQNLMTNEMHQQTIGNERNVEQPNGIYRHSYDDDDDDEQDQDYQMINQAKQYEHNVESNIRKHDALLEAMQMEKIGLDQRIQRVFSDRNKLEDQLFDLRKSRRVYTKANPHGRRLSNQGYPSVSPPDRSSPRRRMPPPGYSPITEKPHTTPSPISYKQSPEGPSAFSDARETYGNQLGRNITSDQMNYLYRAASVPPPEVPAIPADSQAISADRSPHGFAGDYNRMPIYRPDRSPSPPENETDRIIHSLGSPELPSGALDDEPLFSSITGGYRSSIRDGSARQLHLMQNQPRNGSPYKKDAMRMEYVSGGNRLQSSERVSPSMPINQFIQPMVNHRSNGQQIINHQQQGSKYIDKGKISGNELEGNFTQRTSSPYTRVTTITQLPSPEPRTQRGPSDHSIMDEPLNQELAEICSKDMLPREVQRAPRQHPGVNRVVSKREQLPIHEEEECDSITGEISKEKTASKISIGGHGRHQKGQLTPEIWEEKPANPDSTFPGRFPTSNQQSIIIKPNALQSREHMHRSPEILIEDLHFQPPVIPSKIRATVIAEEKLVSSIPTISVTHTTSQLQKKPSVEHIDIEDDTAEEPSDDEMHQNTIHARDHVKLMSVGPIDGFQLERQSSNERDGEWNSEKISPSWVAVCTGESSVTVFDLKSRVKIIDCLEHNQYSLSPVIAILPFVTTSSIAKCVGSTQAQANSEGNLPFGILCVVQLDGHMTLYNIASPNISGRLNIKVPLKHAMLLPQMRMMQNCLFQNMLTITQNGTVFGCQWKFREYRTSQGNLRHSIWDGNVQNLNVNVFEQLSVDGKERHYACCICPYQQVTNLGSPETQRKQGTQSNNYCLSAGALSDSVDQLQTLDMVSSYKLPGYTQPASFLSPIWPGTTMHPKPTERLWTAVSRGRVMEIAAFESQRRRNTKGHHFLFMFYTINSESKITTVTSNIDGKETIFIGTQDGDIHVMQLPKYFHVCQIPACPLGFASSNDLLHHLVTDHYLSDRMTQDLSGIVCDWPECGAQLNPPKGINSTEILEAHAAEHMRRKS